MKVFTIIAEFRILRLTFNPQNVGLKIMNEADY